MSKIVFRIGVTPEEIDREIATHVEAQLAAAERGEPVRSKRTISFESWAGFFRTMTPNRIAILEYVAAQDGVPSIRALSKALSRDYAAVHHDVAELLKLGLIEKDGNMLRCEVAPLPAEMAA